MAYRAQMYRLDPNDIQELPMLDNIHLSRAMHNAMLERRIAIHQDYKKGLITKKERDQLIKDEAKPSHIKSLPGNEFFKRADSIALEYEKQFLNESFDDFFNGKSGFPKYHSRNKDRWSYKTSVVGNNIKVSVDKNGIPQTLKLPKIKEPIKVIGHRALPAGRVKSVVISFDKVDGWYASILIDTDFDDPEVWSKDGDLLIDLDPHTMDAIGIDLGLTDYIVTNKGDKVANPKFFTVMLERLRREQRSLSRMNERVKKLGLDRDKCKNYQKQKRKVAKIHRRITRQRDDFLHKLSHYLVKNHDIIAIETLRVRNLVKNRKLSRSISTAAWSTFVNFLEYKALRAGKVVIKIGTFYASSQICSCCGDKNPAVKDLKVRKWTCPNCHAHHDRDINAAINILAEGLHTVGCTDQEISDFMSGPVAVGTSVGATRNLSASAHLESQRLVNNLVPTATGNGSGKQGVPSNEATASSCASS